MVEINRVSTVFYNRSCGTLKFEIRMPGYPKFDIRTHILIRERAKYKDRPTAIKEDSYQGSVASETRI